ncbi:MAG: threonylcarbamoyl-AMP synthase [Bacteroidetes bacterium]|nr:threonylcarbamoyl-AMP synthase [Bacteroidota bacterium]MBI3481526.1 threonylcarbamoyl-AMP synthase [Bacteroidota bacterium]
MAEIGKDIAKAKALLEQGKLVAIPTETVYGLAGNALDASSVTKIFAAKDRPFFDPLIVHVPDVDAVKKYTEEIPDKASSLMKEFWPGPITLLLNKKDIIPDLVTSGLDRVGVRCPNHELTRELLKSLSFPLAAPSANPFGYVSPTKPEHVNEQLGGKIDYILDGGECNIGIESTIVGFENDSAIIYRVGGLSVEKIELIIGEVVVSTQPVSNPLVPGQLQSHYAPRKILKIGNIEKLLEECKHIKISVLSFQKRYASDSIEKQIVLSASGDLNEAAQKLFSALRELDKSTAEIILSEEVPDIGLGRAINDRLRRASVNSKFQI